MDGLFDLVVLVFEFDELGVDKEAQPVRWEWAGEEGLGFLMKFFEQLFDLLGAVAQAEGLEGAAGGIEAFGAQQDVAQELLIGFGEMALVFRQEGRIEALAGAGPVQLNGGAADLEGTGGSKAVGAILRMVLEVELTLLLEGGVEDMGQARLQQLGQVGWRKLALQLGAVG